MPGRAWKSTCCSCGLESLLQREPDFVVLARCKDGREALQAVRQHQPDVVLLDLHMPVMDGLAVLREMKKEQLATRVVLLTAVVDEEEALEAIRLWVSGVLLKEMSFQLLVQCVRKVHAGGQWLEKRSFGRAIETMLRREAGARQMAEVLTPRETEVMRLVARGLRNKEIAGTLNVSEGTIKVHLHHIYEKLQVDGRLELILFARDNGLV